MIKAVIFDWQGTLCKNVDSENIPLLNDGVANIISFLMGKGVKFGIVSNKSDYNLKQEVAKCCIGRFFAPTMIRGVKHVMDLKPNPKMLEEMCLRLNLLPRDVYFVGDSEQDLECAINAFCVPIKYGDKSQYYPSILNFSSFDHLSAHIELKLLNL